MAKFLTTPPPAPRPARCLENGVFLLLRVLYRHTVQYSTLNNNKKQESWSRLLGFIFESGGVTRYTAEQRLPNFLFSCKSPVWVFSCSLPYYITTTTMSRYIRIARVTDDFLICYVSGCIQGSTRGKQQFLTCMRSVDKRQVLGRRCRLDDEYGTR